MEYQNKVISNIIKYMDELNIEIKDNDKIKSYSNYLSKITTISEKRLNNILDNNKKRTVRLNEVVDMAISLDVDFDIIFK